MGGYSLESPQGSHKSDEELKGNYISKVDDDNGSSHGSSSGGSSDEAKVEVVKPTMVGVGEVVSRMQESQLRSSWGIGGVGGGLKPLRML